MQLSVHADCAVLPGSSHLASAAPCQDYALAHCDGRTGWAVVADGCSTGGHTDIGARMWAHAAKQLLVEQGLAAMTSTRECAEALVQRAAPLLAPFDFSDGYATLAMAASDGVTARVQVFGDGVVAELKADGNLKIWDIRYERNAPRYLAYERSPFLLQQWEAAVAGSSLKVFVTEYSEDGALLHSEFLTWSAADLVGVALPFADVQNTQALFLCTDGATSFDGASTFRSVFPLTQVKNPTGQYMQRRLGALARKWRAAGEPGPVDDLAVAALWFKPA